MYTDETNKYTVYVNQYKRQLHTVWNANQKNGHKSEV